MSFFGHHKLPNKIAIVTGGDNGIGRAVAIALAEEGADILIVYLNEHIDAHFTQTQILAKGRRCEMIAGDIGKEAFCKKVIDYALNVFGKIDILVNNTGFEEPQDQRYKTFHTNVYGMIFLCRAAMPYLQKGCSIINTSSVTFLKKGKQLLDYAATKGAIISFTRSLAKNLAHSGIRVNAIAPGPIWNERQSLFMKGLLRPSHHALCFVFLASDEASYITGQVLHLKGGEIVKKESL